MAPGLRMGKVKRDPRPTHLSTNVSLSEATCMFSLGPGHRLRLGPVSQLWAFGRYYKSGSDR